MVSYLLRLISNLQILCNLVIAYLERFHWPDNRLRMGPMIPVGRGLLDGVTTILMWCEKLFFVRAFISPVLRIEMIRRTIPVNIGKIQFLILFANDWYFNESYFHLP